MRSSKNRSRSKGSRNRSVGNVVNRVFDSSGPEGKVRGTPQQIIDKYNQLMRDAQLSGDRVAAENFAQHAEHYTRLLGEAQREQDARREQQDAQSQKPRENGHAEAQSGGGGGDRDHQEQPAQPSQAEAAKASSSQRAAEQASATADKADDAPQDAAAPKASEAPARDGGGLGEVIDTGADDAGLVETPEDKPKRSRRRKPKTEAAQDDAQASAAE